MIPYLSVSKTGFRLILLCSLLALLHGPGAADPPYSNCVKSNDYTVNSMFHDNLSHLFDFSSSNASLLPFHNVTVGDDPDRVYGLFLCFGFVSQNKCKPCVDSAIQDIKRLCPNSKEAIVYEEYCQFGYSNRIFFGYVDETEKVPLFNKKNITDPDHYKLAAKELLDDLSKQAAFNSTTMYATGDTNFTKDSKIYGFVQCTRDLYRDDCNRCLQISIRDILSCCYFSRGARVYSKSCYVRYELYAFYEGKFEASPLPSSVLTTSDGDSKKVLKSLILVIVSACVAVALLGSCVYCLVVKKGTQKERNKIFNQEDPLHDNGGTASAESSHQVLQEGNQMKL